MKSVMEREKIILRGIIPRFLLGLFATVTSVAFPQDKIEIPVSGPLIIDQHIYPDSNYACGPASIFNLLQFGPESYQKARLSLVGANKTTRFRFLIERYFRNQKSVVNSTAKRWNIYGVKSADLANGLNDLLKENKIPPLKASYLDKKDGESDALFLKRIHEWMSHSVSRGVPPILSLKSYMVRRRKENNFQPGWEAERHHYVVVTSLPKKLSDAPPSRGFEAIVIDSNGAIQRPVFIHLESNAQAFRALKGDETDDQWLDGRPYLLVEASQIRAMRPADMKWSDRFIVVANFLIGDF